MSYFVTGTDTGVGKTLISCALLHGYAAQGKRVVGMKPIAAGCDAQGNHDDVVQLRAAGNVQVSYQQINPYCLPLAVAPYVAAQHAGIALQFAPIVAAYRDLSALAEVVIVEGVGGFCVPLNAQQDSADLAQLLGLPTILVVGVRLGCLNHALLTVAAIAARNMQLAGWVANLIDADMAMQNETLVALQQRIMAPLLGVVPNCRPVDASFAASRLDLDILAR